MCTQYSIMDDNDHEDIAELGTKGAQYFKDVNKVVMKFNKEVHRLNGTTHPDTLLAAVAANEEIMTKSNYYHVDVETIGELTRGYSLVDINNRLERSKMSEFVKQSIVMPSKRYFLMYCVQYNRRYHFFKKLHCPN